MFRTSLSLSLSLSLGETNLKRLLHFSLLADFDRTSIINASCKVLKPQTCLSVLLGPLSLALLSLRIFSSPLSFSPPFCGVERPDRTQKRKITKKTTTNEELQQKLKHEVKHTFLSPQCSSLT
jgi:hypothetical protein